MLGLCALPAFQPAQAAAEGDLTSLPFEELLQRDFVSAALLPDVQEAAKLPYTLEEQPWPHQQIRPAKFSDMIPVLRRAANAYNEPKYELAAKKLQEKDSRVLVDLMYPSNVQ